MKQSAFAALKISVNSHNSVCAVSTWAATAGGVNTTTTAAATTGSAAVSTGSTCSTGISTAARAPAASS